MYMFNEWRGFDLTKRCEKFYRALRREPVTDPELRCHQVRYEGHILTSAAFQPEKSGFLSETSNLLIPVY